MYSFIHDDDDDDDDEADRCVSEMT